MTSSLRHSTILAVDPGERRCGVAVADLETRFARPVEVIDVAVTDPVSRVSELASEHNAIKVVVGRPLDLTGRAGPAVQAYKDFVERLRKEGLDIAEHDERMTTVIAERSLRAGGAKPSERKDVRDAIAAQVLLQDFLDSTSEDG